MKFLIIVLFLAVASLPSCEDAGEAVDNFDSKQACQDYCAKKDDCKDEQSSADQISACVSTCRNDIEDNCGNEHQGPRTTRSAPVSTRAVSSSGPA